MIKLILEDPRLIKLRKNSFEYSYLLKIVVAFSSVTLLIWKYSLYWCCDGSPFKISNNVTSTTLPIAVLSFVIGTYATGTLLKESGANTVIHLFSFHLSLIFRVFYPITIDL